MSNSIDVENNRFTFNNNDIQIIFDGDKKPWFNGNNIASILGYVRTRNCISSHVDERYKTTYLELKKYNTQTLLKCIHPDSTYIDESGVCSLLGACKNRNRDFKYWMYDELFPVLRKYQYDVFRLEDENTRLRNENALLKDDKERLENDKERLENEIERLEDENERFEYEDNCSEDEDDCLMQNSDSD